MDWFGISFYPVYIILSIVYRFRVLFSRKRLVPTGRGLPFVHASVKQKDYIDQCLVVIASIDRSKQPMPDNGKCNPTSNGLQPIPVKA